MAGRFALLVAFGARRAGIAQHELDRDKALARLGDAAALAAERGERLLILAGHGTTLMGRELEDAVRQGIDRIARAAQDLACTTDDRVDEPDEHRFRVLAGEPRALGARREALEGLG